MYSLLQDLRNGPRFLIIISWHLLLPNIVQHIFSNPVAFAALRGDGVIVTWGHSAWGGDSSAVHEQLVSGLLGR